MLVLASASPRRIEMIKNAGYDPIVKPASIIETVPYPMDPENATMFLALKKASAVYEQLLDDQPAPFSGQSTHIFGRSAPFGMKDPADGELAILAADTVVVSDGQIIGKPTDPGDAFAILASLRGRAHHVITGCCIIRSAAKDIGVAPNDIEAAPPQKICLYEDTAVWFKDYTDEELLAYVNTPEPYDKAGGYAIQGSFGKYIDHIDGDFDNVVGLPLGRVLEFI